MRFEKDLVPGRLIRRYKRFLADIELEDGEVVTAHCTNSGSMATCLEIGAPVLLSEHEIPHRKTRYTWEMILINNNWVGVNTTNANKLAFEFLSGRIKQDHSGNANLRREVTVFNSRIDFMAEYADAAVFFEVKNVSMKVNDWAVFPDAVTRRGKKHLETLLQLKKDGHSAAMIYIIQRQDISRFKPAFSIDPEYATMLKKAWKAGVDIIPLQAVLSPEGIFLGSEIPYDLDD